MIKNWKISDKNDLNTIQKLQKELGVSEFIAKLLNNRQINDYGTAKDFFRPTLDNLYDPFDMYQMDKAVDRLLQAINNKEKILVYGDYDVDGTTSVAMMYSFLKNELNANVDFYIPDRYKEGYGISIQGIDYAEERNQTLIIALDCGIRAIDQIDYANKKNIDFIICDHHRPGDQVPDAVAVLDPLQEQCNYPFKGLSGCGVGFKLLQGVCQKYPLDESLAFQYLDLLTISIGADIVSLSDENRIFAHFGLKLLAESPRIGIQSMKEHAEFTKDEMTITDVVFTLAPRINAAGRISSGKDAVKLLIANNNEEATSTSRAIENNNKHRKEMDKSITQEALQKIKEEPWYENAWSTVMFGDNWHKGVIGIVASRLIENYYRPTIVLTKHEGVLTGSARSIRGFDIHHALTQCSDLLDKFGGHTMAAGMSLDPKNFDAFQKKFELIVRESLTEEDLIPTIDVETELNFDKITPKFFRILKQFAPFGPDNMRPVFMTRKVYNAGYTKTVGADKTHLKLHVLQKGIESKPINGIGFSLGDFAKDFINQELFDIVYSIDENTWKGNTSLQLMVKDIRPTEEW